MLQLWKRVTTVLFFLTFIFALHGNAVTAVEGAEDDYDPQHTMLALNMAIVSVHRIVTTGDRIILDQEYQNIINNLSLGNIEDDNEIQSLYEDMMDAITHKTLRQEDVERFRRKYDLREKNLLVTSLSGIRAYGGDPWSFLGSLLTSSVSAYFGYQESKNELLEGLDDELWQLEKEEVLEVNDLQKRLLNSSWTLLRKYRLPDAFRLTQKNLDDFYKAVQEADRERATRMFRMLEPNFKVYPPFWFFYGKAAMESGDAELASKCFAEFENVWRAVLRQDPYRVEVAKFRVMELAGKKASNEEIRAQLDIIRENTPREEWNNNLFAGVMYFSIGEQKLGIDLLNINVDFDVERDVSSLVLRSMEQGKLNIPQLSKELQGALVALNERDELERQRVASALAAASASSADGEVTKGLIAYFENRDQEAVDIFTKLRETSSNPVPFHVLQNLWLEGAIKFPYSYWVELSRQINQQFEQSRNSSMSSYKEIFPVVEGYINKNNSRAMNFAGHMYRFEFGVEQDYKRAAELYRKAAEQGYVSGQDNLGDMYYYGRGVDQDYKQAFEWYRKAAEQGYAITQYNLGNMYYDGEGVEQNYTKAAEWYRKAAEQGYADAQNRLGVLYYRGQGVNQDYKQAADWQRKAAEQGNIWGQYNLADAYYNGEGVNQDYKQAADWFRKAAEQGYASAQKNLADAYYNGQGVIQDHKQAADWYRKAADQGYAFAQFSLCWLYYSGQGVNQDHKQAADWYRKAADQGNASAQDSLGDLYYKGEGVNQDYRQAAYWYRKSAEQGYSWGQYDLGRMYYDGNGVAKDREEAYVYFYLAHLNGNKSAQEKLDDLEGKGIINTLTFSGLSKEQIARARRKAEELQRKLEN